MFIITAIIISTVVSGLSLIFNWFTPSNIPTIFILSMILCELDDIREYFNLKERRYQQMQKKQMQSNIDRLK